MHSGAAALNSFERIAVNLYACPFVYWRKIIT